MRAEAKAAAVPPCAAHYPGVRVAVTGASGFIGGQLARRLVQLDARVTLLVRDPERLDPLLRQRCELVPGDLLDRAAVEQLLHGATLVFHCAANVATWDRWPAYQAANVQGVEMLLSVLAANPAALRRLVHLSTMDVYGFPAQPASESAPLRPLPFGYGESKRQGELRVRQQCERHGLSHVVVRPGNIIGPGSPFIRRIGQALRSGVMLEVNRGAAHAGLMDVDNLIDLLIWAAVAPSADQQLLNARDPWAVSWGEFLRDLRAALPVRGRLLNLDRHTAMGLARLCGALHRRLHLRGEPLLHPLIVEIFGRSCGHSIETLNALAAPIGRIDYQQSLRRSVDWLLATAGG